jgi:exonuclease SbcC
MKTALSEKVGTRRHRIEVRELAQDLLSGAGQHMSRRFNHDLRTLVGRTLPLFTDGRYEHLQIDSDLGVRVFSSDKRDYMDLDEISSGTQRQIMLALRLALSQELVNSAALGSQFVFLDEPFAFFDDERTRTSLRVLPQLSDEINQVWIVSQEFPPEAAFDRHIRCARDYDRLQEAG